MYIAGEDARMERLRLEALMRGHILTDVAACDACALPQPDSQTAAEKLLAIPGRGRRAIVGRLSDKTAQALANAGWRVCRALENECYALANALLSAEGAVFYAMEKSERALRGSVCCITGYGRIGRELARLLLALGARVRVVARREESRAAARNAGAAAYDVTALTDALRGCDFVFNTVPSPLLDERALLSMPLEAIVMELASKPYGVNMEAAKRAGVRAYLESGIPARYAPRTAACLLMDYAEAVEENE